MIDVAVAHALFLASRLFSRKHLFDRAFVVGGRASFVHAFYFPHSHEVAKQKRPCLVSLENSPCMVSKAVPAGAKATFPLLEKLSHRTLSAAHEALFNP